MLKHEGVTGQIMKAFYRVYNALGYGFLEKVYENALAHELRKDGLSARQQSPIRVHYDGQVVGDFFADLLVEECVIVELKATESLCPEHHAQLINYLQATDIEVGLLLNFGRKPEACRKVLDRDRK